MKTLYFDTNHIDLVGGGGLALYNLSVALQENFDVYLASSWNEGMARYDFLRPPKRPWKFGRPDKVDVFVASRYAEYVKPQGKVNVFYCLYPRYRWDMSGYDRILTLSRYCQEAVARNWNRKSEILVGGAFASDYSYSGAPKENNFLSCARFFMEGNQAQLAGHSKGQHHLIEAFLNSSLYNWTLTLAGSVLLDSDRDYLAALERLACGDRRIFFRPMVTKEGLRELYARSKVFLHGMGFGRIDEAEVEHYGIVVEKALLSGCAAVVHKSGGAPEFSHCAWSSVDELSRIMRAFDEPIDHGAIARGAAQRFTWENFSERVREIFHAYA